MLEFFKEIFTKLNIWHYTIMILIFFLIFVVSNYDKIKIIVQDINDGWTKYFPEKFESECELKILILPFELYGENNDKFLNTEKLITKWLDEQNDKNDFKICIKFDKNQKQPKNLTDALEFCKENDVDLLLYGELFNDQLNNEVRIKWIIKDKFGLRSDLIGDSKIQPIKKFSDLSNGYLLDDVEIFLNWYKSIILINNNQIQRGLENLLLLKDKFKTTIYKEPLILNTIANCYEKLHEYQMAIQYYNLSISADSSFSPAYNNLGLILFWEFKEFDKGIDFIKKSLELDDTQYISASNLAWIYENHYEEFEMSKLYYELALKNNPAEINSILNLAKIYENQDNDFIKAEELYLRVLKIEPLNPILIEQYAIFVGRTLREYERAKVLHLKSIKLNPNYASPYNSLAHLYLIEQNFEKAKLYFEKAINTNPNFPEPYTVYGALLYKNFHDTINAKKYLLKSIDLFKLFDNESDNIANAYNNLGLYYVECENDFNEAEKQFILGLSLKPDNALILYNLLNLYIYSFKNKQRALNYYKQYQRINKEFKKVNFELFLRSLELIIIESNNIMNYKTE